MEKNGREAIAIEPHSIWIFLPTELWFQIFSYLRATRYIALVGVISKGFREFVVEYFKTVSTWMNKNMNVAVIGAPDVGKTTLLAQLLLQVGQNNIGNRFNHYMRQQPKIEAASLYNTFLNSQHTGPAVHTHHVYPFYVNTSLHNFTIFDTPGMRKIITAYRICSQVDTAILVVSRYVAFDPESLINEVTAVLTSLTHSHFIIAVNYTRIPFTQGTWESDRKLIQEKLTKAVPPKLIANIKVIPINALDGFNIYSPYVSIDDTRLWYTGPTLFRALHAVWEKLEYPEEREQMPFSMTVLRHFRVKGSGPILIGIVNSGCAKPDMKIRICGTGLIDKKLTIGFIQHNKKPIPEAKPSDHVGISFTSASQTAIRDASGPGRHWLDKVHYGTLVTSADHPAKRVKSFVVALASAKFRKMHESKQYKAIYQGNHIFVVFEKFIQVLDKQHNDVTPTRNSILPGDSCLALCVPTQEMWTFPKKGSGKSAANPNKKRDSKDVILFTTHRQIHAVGRIDTITFFSDEEVQSQPAQFAHKKQPQK